MKLWQCENEEDKDKECCVCRKCTILLVVQKRTVLTLGFYSSSESEAMIRLRLCAGMLCALQVRGRGSSSSSSSSSSRHKGGAILRGVKTVFFFAIYI